MPHERAELIGLPLQTVRMPDGRRQLSRDLSVGINVNIEATAERTLTVPKGTLTDYSSIPWFGRFWVHWSKVDIAGVVHDHLYQQGLKTRSQSDKIWRIMARSGDHHASLIQAWVCWFVLRCAGWHAWGKYRKSDSIQK